MPQIELPPLTPVRDAAVAEQPPPDGAVLCEDDRDCDDGIRCTRDRCLPRGYCSFAADHSRCADDVFCNGDEVCDHAEGCLEGRPRHCNDGDVCTVDSCDEQGKRCVYAPRDFDDDGEVDWHCFSGTDCDDLDATRGARAAEICRDYVDNDCDGQVDETEDCGVAEHDRCDEALDVSGGGTFVVSLAGATPDYSLSCSSPGDRDVAFVFRTEKAQDVTLAARGVLRDGSRETAVLALRANCDDLASERECVRGFPSQLRIRALPEGEYFVVAQAAGSVQIVLDVTFEEASDAPPNMSCSTPIDVSEGGTFAGDLVDVSDEDRISCGLPDSGELFYSFTTTELADVEVSAVSLSGDSGDRMFLSVRSDCDDPATATRCLADAPARGRLHELPPGTYYIVVEGPATREVDFNLDVAFLEPTPPPPGDGCGDPEVIAPDGEVSGSLAGLQDLVNVECGCSEEAADEGLPCGSFYSERVYSFELDEAADLRIELDGGTTNVGYDLRRTCDDPESQLRCRIPGRIDDRVRNLPAGEHFLIVESPEPASFTLRTEILPLTVPLDVSDNPTCGAAVEIPPEGGLFRGDTVDALNDYAAVCGAGAPGNDVVFRLELESRSRVTVTTEATFDTVLSRITDTGEGADSCRAPPSEPCNDDYAPGSGTDSRLEETLDPGVYYYIVDGFKENDEGQYLLEVVVGDA